jgi:glycosyltransferase involved in cell wall biosynthesis
MRIGMVVLAAGRKAGGPETYEIQLIRALAGIDTETEYFVYCTSRDAAHAVGRLPENFVVRVLQPPLRALSLSITLPRLMAADGVDFFHATYAPPPVPTRPFLFTMHCVSNFARPEFYPAFIRWRLNALQRIGLRRAASILCVSNFVRQYLRETFHTPAERLATVYNGVGPEFFRSSPADARSRVADEFGIDGPYLLYVGKLQARKNVIGLIRAYARYREETGSDARLVLAGRRVETSEGIDEAIRALGLQNVVMQPGYVAPPAADPASALPYLYSGARMTLFPSFYEGFGIPVVEAMACGSPLIVSNVTSLPEIAGDAALLVDPASIEDMAEAMARIDRSSETRDELIELGVRRARLFTWENCARETLGAYRRLSECERCD